MRSPMLWSPSHTAMVTSPTTDTPISKGIRPPCAYERQLPHVSPADTKMPTAQPPVTVTRAQLGFWPHSENARTEARVPHTLHNQLASKAGGPRPRWSCCAGTLSRNTAVECTRFDKASK